MKAGISSAEMKRTLDTIKKNVSIGPERLEISIAGSCNIKCMYCWYYSPKRKIQAKLAGAYNAMIHKNTDYPFIPEEKFKEIIDAAKKMATHTIIITSRGEPFIHPRFEELMKYAKDAGLQVIAETNGTMLKAKQRALEYIDELKINLPSVHAETYAQLQPHHSPALLARTLEGIAALAEFKKSHVNHKATVIYVLNVLNSSEKELRSMLDFMLEHRLDRLHLKMMGGSESIHLDELLLKKDDEAKLVGTLKQIAAEEKYTGIETNILSLIHYLTQFVPGGIKKCFIGYFFATIDLYGETRLCCSNMLVTIGNIYRNTFEELWFSKRAQDTRNKMEHISGRNVFCISCDTKGSRQRVEKNRAEMKSLLQTRHHSL